MAEVPARLEPARDVAHKERLMDETRITRSSPSSTRAIVADEGFCGQVAALLLCEPGPIHDAFVGEPAEDVLEMVRWALSHEDDDGFDPALVLTSWAKKRGRGAWSGRPRPEQDPYEELAKVLGRYWREHPGELTTLLDRAEVSLNGRS
jgi:hypothetical protein